MYLNGIEGNLESIHVVPGRGTKLGRSNVPSAGDNNETTKVSRHVCTVYGPEDADSAGPAEVVAEKGRLYIQPSGAKQWTVLQPGRGQKHKINLGDVIALHRRAIDGAYMFKFLAEEQNAVMTPPAKTTRTPKPMSTGKGRQLRITDTYPTQSSDDGTETSGAMVGKRPGSSLETGAKRPRTAANIGTMLSPGSVPGSPAAHKNRGKGLFADLHIVFWTTKHMKTLIKNATAAGAHIEETITAQTTHVIGSTDMSAAQISQCLQGVDKVRDCTEVEYQGTRVQIPNGASLVTPDFLSASLAEQRLVLKFPYLLPVQRQALSQGQPSATSEESGEGEAGVSGGDKGTAGPSAHGLEPGPATTPNPVPSSTRARTAPPESLGLISPVFAALAPGRGEVPSFTGGDSGVLWGTAGVWLEPFTTADAQRTINIIDRHWHNQPGRRSSEEEEQAGPEPLLSAAESAAPQLRNRVCAHIACSDKPYCLVAELERTKANYSDRGPDQFKIKAIEKGIRALLHHGVPLRVAGDVDTLRTADGGTVGQGTRDKLKEILARGFLQRNLELEKNEEHQCVQLFFKVWGVGDVTARKWFHDGCRTLDDVRKRRDLTEQQTVGLKYFDDFQKRIPADVVSQVEEIVQNAVLDVLDCRGALDAHRFFCFAVGSYCRGKPATGDIDFLILPPDSLGAVNCSEVLARLLRHLLNIGLLVDEMNASHPNPRLQAKGSASWMGVAKPPGLSYHIRIDIKVYPRESLTFAVNYFIGSGPFVRALRYWARTSETCAALAKKVNKGANGFKLSDTHLVPIVRKEGGRQETFNKTEEIELGPAVECESETALFEALKLKYVPPKMRFFGPNYQ